MTSSGVKARPQRVMKKPAKHAKSTSGGREPTRKQPAPRKRKPAKADVSVTDALPDQTRQTREHTIAGTISGRMSPSTSKSTEASKSDFGEVTVTMKMTRQPHNAPDGAQRVMSFNPPLIYDYHDEGHKNCGMLEVAFVDVTHVWTPDEQRIFSELWHRMSGQIRKEYELHRSMHEGDALATHEAPGVVQ